MDFFDKISNITKNAVDKTGDMIEINSLKGKISTEEAKINDFKSKIGEFYWQRFGEGAALEEEASKLCQEIKNSMAIIEGFNMDIEKIKADQTSSCDGKFCPSCGVQVAEGVKFCSECGAKIE